MDPFNIIIKPGASQVDLNIHPQEAGTYKVIYHGALLGEIFMGSDGENWEAVTAEELEPGGFPFMPMRKLPVIRTSCWISK